MRSCKRAWRRSRRRSERPPPRRRSSPSAAWGTRRSTWAPSRSKTADRKPGAGEVQKVALSMKDVPRALPEGNRSAQTEEMSTRAFRDVASKTAATSDGDREPTIEVEAAPVSRTLGGQTERLPVIGSAKMASPWTKDASASPKAAELPSSLRPRDTPAPGDDAPPVIPLRRPGSVGAAITVAVVLVAAVIAVRAATTKRTSAATEPVPAPTVTPNVAPTVTTASQPPAPLPSAPPASAPASATPPSVAPPPQRVPAPVKPPHKSEDRPGDSHVKPHSVPVPPATPTADPSPTPRVAPPASSPPKSAPPPPGPVPMFEKEKGS